MERSGPERAAADLGGRVARGAGWILAARLVMGGLGFASAIIVARLLAPEAFGIIAVSVTAMQLLQNVSDFGAAQAVVRFRDAGRGELDTLFTLSALRGGLVALLLAAGAPLAAAFYGDPRYGWALLGASLCPLLSGFNNPRFFEFERAIDFSRDFAWQVAAKLASAATAILVALAWRNYWAIIAGLVAGAGVQLVLSYALRPYRPRPSFAAWRRVAGFSGWLAGVSFFAALNNKIDSFILARLLGATGAGTYYYGLQLADLTTRELAQPLARAVYPGLSALQGARERMREAFLASVEAMGAIALPASLGLAFVARDAIALLLGEKWLAAAPVVAWLAPVLGLQTLLAAAQYYAMALGLARFVFAREAAFFLIRTPIFIWAALAHGLAGALAAAAGCGALYVALNLRLYARASGRPLWEPLARARRSLIAAAAMAAYFLVLRPHLDALAGAPVAARLAADVAAGAGVFVAAMAGLWALEGRPAGVERRLARLAAGVLARPRAERPE
ncbi:oligosaccharide flippase family protein [Amphiplicatus metriothermophilus]|uniref:Polysaccharide transporter, PST family n=1 Tax=Amphiplicatus metriothermophilus TaxID=1519374 RepID=A0A239PLK8_9PROT|nr:oligosaccharide flippase family protein [Amphiplicatus metriothermophilus]MBB5517446.1 PST family polysaccharide transporter [Amphiplicatus metriothermophilus]SNT68219.1 polysaccharide transporter, PST family [Amphiplicatus metriothermophilus]